MKKQQSKPSIEALRSALQTAVKRFNESSDREGLLCPRHKNAKKKTSEWAAASERSIAHRLAFYLECELWRSGVITKDTPIVVDCEYNRHLGEVKDLKAKQELEQIVKKARRKPIRRSGEDGYFVFSVAPDVIVHKRQTDEFNLLVIELKKASNTESPEYDDLKLDLFTKPKGMGYEYKLGASVVARDDLMPSERRLEIRQKEYPVPKNQS